MSEAKSPNRFLDYLARWWPLWFAGALTALFGLWVWSLALEVTVEEGVSARRLNHFLSGRPNEMGDTLAGFVGSLTLIWVIASVLQQSMELRAQRQEFREMVVAQTAQVNALNKQAEIFEDEKRQREWDQIERVLDALLVDLARKCELLNSLSNSEFELHEDDYSSMTDTDFLMTTGPHRETAKPFSTDSEANIDERVHRHAKALMLFYLALLHGDRHTRCCKRVRRGFFDGLGEHIDRILDQAKTASKAQKVRIASLNLESMRGHLNEILLLDIWLSEAENEATP